MGVPIMDIKQQLKNFNLLENEIILLREQVDREQKKQLADTVRGSSKNPPYITHTITVQGVNTKPLYKLKRMLAKREKEYTQILDYVDSIDDSIVRQAIMLYYMSGYGVVSWQWVATQMKRPQDAEAIRKAVNRYLQTQNDS